jgi:hypothetical protein
MMDVRCLDIGWQMLDYVFGERWGLSCDAELNHFILDN